jgi:DNA-binding XRE family transcriptional regulator
VSIYDTGAILTWGSNISLDDYEVQEDRTNIVRKNRQANDAPDAILELAQSLADILETTTSGSLIRRSLYSNVCVYVGRALMFKPSKPLRTIIETQAAQIEQEPHLAALQWIKEATGFSQQRIGLLVGVTRQTLYLWERGGEITDSNRRRIFGIRDVLRRAQKHYPKHAQFVEWLDAPGMLDGRSPAELLAQGEIDSARLLAVTTPSPSITLSHTSTKHRDSVRFRSGQEARHEPMRPSSDDELLAEFGEPGDGEDD